MKGDENMHKDKVNNEAVDSDSNEKTTNEKKRDEVYEYLVLVLGGLEELVSEQIKLEISSISSVLDIQIVSPDPRQYPNTRDGIRLGNAGVGQLVLQTDAEPEKVLGLRCVQALYSLLLVESELYESDPVAKHGGATQQALDRFEQLLHDSPQWEKALDLWERCMVLRGREGVSQKRKAGILNFRGSAVRDGKHGFKSPDLAGVIGSAVGNRYGTWKVNLSEYDVEVVALMWHTHVVVGLCLDPSVGPTKTKLATEKREPMASFDRCATLRPSTAHVMTLLAKVQPGEVVLDCMCGVGTIPIEAAVMHRSSFALGGEIEPKCLPEIRSNISSFRHHPSWRRSPGVDVCSWDATNLPLRDGSVDCVIVDMPFGVSCGSTKHNKKIYPRIFNNIARILRTNGRAVLLVYQPKFVLKLVENDLWETRTFCPVNVGGLVVAIFVLLRTGVQSDDIFTKGNNQTLQSNSISTREGKKTKDLLANCHKKLKTESKKC